ncbi:MAG: hypothetical protein IPL55_07550 [Saprospiraceae bacterium]|nr:hypothetical protein [Saprospiraceae bacterium]
MTRAIFFTSIFSLYISYIMRHTLHLPDLTFDPGTIIFSPGIISILEREPTFRSIIDHFLVCHLATDFGIVSRVTRFDNTLAALLDIGQFTSRYFIPHTITSPERLTIITSFLDQRTTVIRFPFEQM